MQRLLKLEYLLLGIILFSQCIPAQSNLEVFGFFQARLTRLKGGYTVEADLTPFGMPKTVVDQQNDNYLSVNLQQLNLFFRKELNDNFTAWVNFEVTSSFNSKNQWGSFSLEEAWVNYQSNNYLNVKAGLLIPKFSYLNEIKNRMPLLPYITRPLVYESTISAIDHSDYLPERAYLQVYGYIPISSVTLDYAAFVGPSERDYILPDGAFIGPATDTTNFKLFGGRVGLNYSDLRFGVSATFDKDNQQKSIKENVPRTRVAFDLGYSLYNFSLDGEYIAVNLSPKNTDTKMNKLFYYGTLEYNFTDNIFGYATYSFLKDESNDVLKAGMTGIVFGLGYKPSESVVVKAGYSRNTINSTFKTQQDPLPIPFDTKIDSDIESIQAAVSVMF